MSKHRAKFAPHDVEMDAFTYGNEPGSVLLVHKLNDLNDSNLTKRIGPFFCKYMKALNFVVQAEPEMAHYLLDMIKHDALEKLKRKRNVPNHIYSHLDGLIKVKYRQAIEKLKEGQSNG